VEWEQCVALIAVVAGCLARLQWASHKKHLQCTSTRASATRHRHLWLSAARLGCQEAARHHRRL